MSNLRRQKSSDPPSHRTEQGGGGESAEASSPVKEDSQSKSPFDIPAKNPNEESLRRWRRHTLTLNPSRRFRYTKRFRVGTMALVYLGRLQKNVAPPSSAPKVDKDKKPGVVGGTARGGELTADALEKLVNDRDSDALSEAGGPRGILASLQTGADQGILDSSPEEIVHRKQKYGENTYPHKPSRTFLSYVWEAFHDRTLIILLVCAALSLAFGIKSDGIAEGWYEGTSIGAAVCLVILVTAVSDYKQGLQFQGLNDEKNNIQVEVIRGGRRMRISIYELVVGDIVPFNLGDQIPGDGILVDGHSVKIDSSSMTGETELLKASAEHPFLQSGCKVADGYGTMVITGVGMHTEWGKLMTSISEDNDEETPLQVRLNGVATLIGKIGLSVAGLVFVILIIFYFVGHSAPSEGTPMFKAGTTSISDAINVVVDIFAIGVTIIVVAVPEGLPLAVTLTLAYSMRKMMADKALVRRLAACETMGSATTICSDKTGTLTVNEMTIVKAWVAGNVREAAAEDIQGLDPKLVGLLHEGISQNSSGSVFILENGKPEVTGSPTEKAALFWGIKMGMDFTKVRAQSNVLQVETFNSEKKRAGVAVKPSNEEVVHIHWKGAAEIVVGVCDRCVTEDGSAIEMTEEKRKELLNVIEGMAASSLRCVAFAYRNLDESEMPSSGATITDKQWPESWAIPETRLALLAIVGIKDPCRPGVFDAVRLCQGAGVRVRMLTGDNLVTAKAIATECGILREGDLSMEGSTFRNYTDAERRKVLPSISVMARSLPSDKLMMIKALKAMGEVVAVTGDGTNDAPALHEADIGLSMGIQGTEVAKESSDIIILDDDFRSVVKVVRWGRSVYANIQKFIQFQLTVNVAALSINFVSAVSSGTVPLTAVQLLWVNLIMDTLGALALATEPPTDELMRWAPVGRSKPLITNVMWRNLLGQSLFQVIVLLTFQFKGEDIFKLRGKPDSRVIKDTIIFNTFVLCQVFNEVNARKPTEFNIFKGLLGNRMFLGIIATTLILQVLIVEFLSKFAATHKLTWQLWLICIGIAFLSWPIALLVKLIPVPPDKDDASCGFVSKKKKKKIALAKEALEKEDVENANHSNTNNNNSSKSQFDLTEKESKSQQQKSPSHNNNNNNNNNNGNVANGK